MATILALFADLLSSSSDILGEKHDGKTYFSPSVGH